MRKGRLYVIGISPGGADTLSVTARRILREAEHVYGGKRLLDMFPGLKCEKTTLGRNLGQATDSMRASLSSRRIAVLASGDPNFFGIASFLREKLGPAKVEVIPGVSAMQLAFARIGESWEDAAFASAHGRPAEYVIGKVMRSDRTAILTDDKNTPSAISQKLLGAGVKNCPVYICQDLGSRNERVLRTDLVKLQKLDCSALNIMVVLQGIGQNRDGHTRLLGIPEGEFYLKSGSSLITKHEVRAVSLAKLALNESSTVWDVGAGSGAVSIEASLLARGGTVFAIEDDRRCQQIIRKNISRFRRPNVQPVDGTAPSGLEGLPDPDAVFIGGSRGRITGIIDLACSRLRPGGKIVVNLVTIENAERALRQLKKNGFTADITLVSVARGRDLAGLTGLEPLTPVFIVAGSRSKE